MMCLLKLPVRDFFLQNRQVPQQPKKNHRYYSIVRSILVRVLAADFKVDKEEWVSWRELPKFLHIASIGIVGGWEYNRKGGMPVNLSSQPFFAASLSAQSFYPSSQPTCPSMTQLVHPTNSTQVNLLYGQSRPPTSSWRFRKASRYYIPGMVYTTINLILQCCVPVHVPNKSHPD